MTILDLLVTPALFFKFGRKVYEHRFDEEVTADEHAVPADLMAMARRLESSGSYGALGTS